MFNIKVTPAFQKNFNSITKRNKSLQEKFATPIGRLSLDPYNISGQYDIKKLTGIHEGDGQWRMRIGDYRIRYDVLDRDVVLHSITYRKNTYS